MFLRSSVKKITTIISVGLLAATGVIARQEQPQPAPPQQDSQQQSPAPADSNGPWAPVGQGQAQPNGPYQPASNAPMGQAPVGSQPGSYPNGGNVPYAGQAPYPQQPSYNQQQGPYSQQGPYGQQQGPYAQQGPYNQQPVPAQLTVPAGTFVTVRVNQLLSSDRNQPGDGFSATLVEPLVVNGVVVAEPGQTIAGQVVEAQKAGRVEGVARLKVQLTQLTLVDGQQVPFQSSLISRRGNTSVGRDAGAIAGTTGLGAVIGAAAGWGRGAAIGAGAGAAVGTLGVLLTRGQPSIIAPEQILTFRIDTPVLVDTTHSVQAFRYVQPNEYDRPVYNQPSPYASYPAPVAVAAAPYYGYGYGYPYAYPYSYAPGFSLFLGSGYYGRGYYGRGFYGGRGYYGGGFRRR